MKKHRIISIALSVIGIVATLSLVFYLLKDRISEFCSGDSSEDAEEDIFDSDLDDLEDFNPAVEEEEQSSSQTKVRRGYIPLKFHSHEEEAEA